MSSRLVMDAFSLLGEGPEHIQQIRRVAVALAITGKLGSGNLGRSPTELFQAVQQVKADQSQRRGLLKSRDLAGVAEENLPRGFADAGRFAPLGEVAQIKKGLTGIKQAVPGRFPLVVTGADRLSCDHFDFEGAAAIIPLVSSTGHGHASLHRLHYQEGQFALGTILAAVFPYEPALVSARFLFEYLSAFKEELLTTRMTGTANVTLTIGGIAEVPVPLVDPQVQRQLDELMTLLDRLEAAHSAREATRDRLTTSSLARLTAPDTSAEAFPAHARFVTGSLPALTTTADQIKSLRQTILNLAVRGKLVEQDQADEPAAALLNRIAAEMGQLARAGKIKEPKRIGSLGREEPSSALPSGWVWTQLADITVCLDYMRKPINSTERQQRIVGTSTDLLYPYFGATQQQGWIDDYIFDEELLLLGEDGVPFSDPFRSKAYVISGKTWVNNHAHVFRGIFISHSFLAYYLNVFDYAGRVVGATRSKLNQARALDIPVPLPPQAEQHRIVVKVEELMGLCNQLDSTLSTADSTKQRLLEALLHEALAGHASDREAA